MLLRSGNRMARPGDGASPSALAHALLFMDVTGLDAETLEASLAALREFASRRLSDEALIDLDERDEFPADVIHKMCSTELGVQLLFIAEEYGGMGGGTFDIYRVCERMARIDVGVATAVLATFLGSDPIASVGRAEQKKEWMSRIADEGLLMAYGATEPEAGSDLAALKTVAVPVDRGRRRRRLPHHRSQAVDLQRRRRRPLLDPRQRARRAVVVRARPRDRRVHPRPARGQARHPAQQHRRSVPRRRRRWAPTAWWGASRARGWSRPSRCSATRG